MILASFLNDLADAWDRSRDSFWPQTGIFLSLTVRAIGLALLFGIPAGIALRGLPRTAGHLIDFLGMMQTVPSLVLLGLFLPVLGIGQKPALLAAVFYSLCPVVMNTYVGIGQVPSAVRDAARGMGMTAPQVLWHVDLPLAFPVVLAGVRTAAVYANGIIVVGALIGAGGLGDFIWNGMSRGDTGLIWLGAIPLLILTLVLFWGLGGLARLARHNSALGMSLGSALIIGMAGYAIYCPVQEAMQPPPANIVIGAKDFTEGQILAEIVAQTIEEHTGLHTHIRHNLGTSLIFNALRTGDIDLYPEYTGNLLTSKDALDLPVPADKTTITPLVRSEMRRRFGLVLLEPFGLNNMYALCVTRATADRWGLKDVSDLARAPQARVVIDLSFLTRPDGWAGLVKKYDLKFARPPIQMSADLIYKALEQKKADVVIGSATAWQIQAYELVVLKDDRGYFPNYHAAPLVREAVLSEHPEIAVALNRLGGRIDDDAMRRLNFQVSVKKRSEKEVAREFLRQAGLLR